MQTLSALLDESQQRHGHRCAGAVLGVRMALAGCRALGIEDARRERCLVVYLEIDRCAADAIQSVTGCSLGKRTLKHLDYGKLAATFLHTGTGDAVRVAVRGDARQRAEGWITMGGDRHAAQKMAYEEMSDGDLLTIERVRLTLRAEDRPGRPTARTVCVRCGEEINDRREVPADDGDTCCSCAFGAYYERLP